MGMIQRERKIRMKPCRLPTRYPLILVRIDHCNFVVVWNFDEYPLAGGGNLTALGVSLEAGFTGTAHRREADKGVAVKRLRIKRAARLLDASGQETGC